MITSNSNLLKPDKDCLEVTGKSLTCSKCRNVAGPPGYTRIRNTAIVGNAGHKFIIYQGLAKKKTFAGDFFEMQHSWAWDLFWSGFLHWLPSPLTGPRRTQQWISLCFSSLLLWKYLLHFSCSLQMCTLCRKGLKFRFQIPLDELHWAQLLYQLLVIGTNHQWQGWSHLFEHGSSCKAVDGLKVAAVAEIILASL